MRLSAPRIAPVELDRLDDDQRAALEPFLVQGRVLNIFRTLARLPRALTAFVSWGGYILSRRNSLPPRERELAILRTGYLCGAGYEWTQHVPIGLEARLHEAEIERIKVGPEATEWSAVDRAILRACDELVGDHFVTTATWDALEKFGDTGRADLVFTVGQYTQVSMILNSFGVQLDPGQQLDPALDRR